MKRLLNALVMGLFCVVVNPLQASTLIKYGFDTQLSSTSYADLSGNGRTVNFNRNVTKSSNYPFSASYPALSGLDYSASTKYNAATGGTVANVSGINLQTTNQFTMEGWVYLEGFANISGAQGGALWSLASSTGGTSVFTLGYNSSGTVTASFNAQSQSGGTRNYTTSTTLSLNTWNHVAYVKTALAIQIYVNGVLVNTFSEAGITSRPLPTALGSVTIGGNIYGAFNDFRLSDTALTATELGYNTPPFTIPEPGLSLTFIGAGMLGGVSLIRRRRARLQA